VKKQSVNVLCNGPLQHKALVTLLPQAPSYTCMKQTMPCMTQI
jgi:hypothetical protein